MAIDNISIWSYSPSYPSRLLKKGFLSGKMGHFYIWETLRFL
jgi:hypothetical protein